MPTGVQRGIEEIPDRVRNDDYTNISDDYTSDRATSIMWVKVV